MKLQRWQTIAMIVVASCGMLLTLTGCPATDQTPPPAGPAVSSMPGPGPGATTAPADMMPAPEDAAPTDEAKPADEAKPSEEAKPADAKPTEEAKPSAPAMEAKPADEAKPSEEAKPSDEAKPVAPAIEAKPADEKPAAPADEKKPAEETKPADQAKPAAAAEAKPVDLPVGKPFQVKIPAGLPELPIPADNPITEEKVALGRRLYFDTRLSKDGTISCATCHDPAKAWTEHEPTSIGIGKQVGGANSPTVINAAYATSQFWDGRAATLEEQAVGPIENPIEMGHKLVTCCAELAVIDEYKQGFEKAFGTPEVTSERIAKAIASFERTILSGNSPYDKFQAGDKAALNDAQKRGMELFDSAGCADCHTPPLFSNYRFINAGIGMKKDKPDPGRMAVTKKDSDLGKFRVAPLREVANTGPYYHDGSVASLEEAVKIMAEGGIPNDNLSAMMKAVGGQKLTDENIKDLVEFLKALSGEYPKE
ncbi:MAG: cytochrome-c peroxidase [Thermoguttaceae bacterium]